MSLNKYRFQLVVVAEDENLVDVAQGFHEGMGGDRRIHVEPVEGPRRSHHGWTGAIASLVNYNLQQCPLRHILLFIDFDHDPILRLSEVWERILKLELENCKSRIHVVGITNQSEDIDRHGGTFRDFGRKVADVCLGRCSEDVWQQSALQDNEEELSRLRTSVCCQLLGNVAG